MAIDLPPGTPPALASLEEVQQHQAVPSEDQSVIQTQAAGYDVFISGNQTLDAQTIKAALQRGNTLSTSVWLLHEAYMQNGDRLTRLRYRLLGNQLLIYVIHGQITEIHGPDSLTRFFWDVDQRRFSIPLIESRRILANLQARREGLKAQARYSPQAPTASPMTLSILTEKNPDKNAIQYEVGLANPGNRFVGRNFLSANITADLPQVQLKGIVNKSLRSLDSNKYKNGELESYQISANSVIPIGFIGAGISQSDYYFTNQQGQEIHGEVTQTQILMQEILYASPSQRNVISQRLIFVDAQSENRQTRQPVLDERYFAAEFGLEHSRRLHFFPQQPLLKLSGKIRKGLGDKSGSFENPPSGLERDPGFLIFKPGAELTWKSSSDWELIMQLESQYSDRQTPEQQQWLLGGPEKLRAKLPGALLGDEGHYFNLEYLPRRFNPWSTVELAPSLFLEAGYSRLDSRDPRLSGSQRAFDAGIAISLELQKTWSLELSVAEAFSEKRLSSELINADDDADFYFALKAQW